MTRPSIPQIDERRPAKERLSHSHSQNEDQLPASERHSLQSQGDDYVPAKEKRSNTQSEERLSAKARLSGGASDERTPATERLSVQTQRIRREEENISDTEAENQMTVLPSHLVVTADTITRPSSSAFFEVNSLGPGDRSPIRTLSEDKVHVSLRLGPLFAEDDDEEENANDSLLLRKTTSKADGKRILVTKDRKRPPYHA